MTPGVIQGAVCLKWGKGEEEKEKGGKGAEIPNEKDPV